MLPETTDDAAQPLLDEGAAPWAAAAAGVSGLEAKGEPAMYRTHVYEPDKEEAPLMDLFQAIKTSMITIVSNELKDASAAGRLAELLAEPDEAGHTVTHWAVKTMRMDILNLLVDNGAPLFTQSTDSVGMAPIHWACTSGHLAALCVCAAGHRRPPSPASVSRTSPPSPSPTPPTGACSSTAGRT